MARDAHGKFVAGGHEGRPKGSLGVGRRLVEEVLARKNCDPVEILADIANGNARGLRLPRGERVSVQERRAAAEALLDRLVPKLKSIEVESAVKGEVLLQLQWPDEGQGQHGEGDAAADPQL